MNGEQERCKVCGNDVQVSINRGTGVCSESCRKTRDGRGARDAESRRGGAEKPGLRPRWSGARGRPLILRALRYPDVRRHLLHWPAECWRVHLLVAEGA